MTCHMARMGWEYLTRFMRSEDGTSVTEYAVMLSLIVLAAATAIHLVGQHVIFVYENIEEAVAAQGM